MVTISEVMAESKNTEYTVIDKKTGFVIVFDRIANFERDEERAKRVYKIVDPKVGLLEEVKLGKVIEEIIEIVSDKVEVKELLEETLRTSDPNDILEALRRLKQPKLAEKTKSTKGCFSLKIAGNRGQRPLELVIRR